MYVSFTLGDCDAFNEATQLQHMTDIHVAALQELQLLDKLSSNSCSSLQLACCK